MSASGQPQPYPRQEFVDHEFRSSEDVALSGLNYERARFRLTSARKVHFRRVSFKYCIFEDCYLRDCRFEDCDFTGATFRNSILRGSTFDGCRFEYCRFAHSIVPLTILERHMPGYENQALELARALRVNYSQVGDSNGVNKAVSAELAATLTHLQKAAWSSESHYRNKYRGLERAGKAVEYAWFRLLDFIWGNGESLPKLVRTLAIAFLLLVGWLSIIAATRGSISRLVPHRLGAYPSGSSLQGAVATVVAVRTVLLGLFIAVLVRRLSRR